jgi:hypothetical protein
LTHNGDGLGTGLGEPAVWALPPQAAMTMKTSPASVALAKR